MDEDSLHEEFLAEAQEIVESLARELLSLEGSFKQGSSDPEALNEIFRGVHTLKGIAGMFGQEQLGALAHALEDLLDDLRLGRVQLDSKVLDVLFSGIEGFQKLLGSAREAREEAVDLAAFAQSIEEVQPKKKDPGTTLRGFDIDPSVLAVLTEYEEHRLRTNVEQGQLLYWLRLRLGLASIDTELASLKEHARAVAEIITYLPSMDEAPSDSIDLDVLLASQRSFDELAQVLGASEGALREVQRKRDEEVIERPQRTTSERPAPPAMSMPPGALSIAPPGETPSEAPLARAESLRSVSDTVRVDIKKLDHLMNVVGELAIVRGAVARVSERLRMSRELRSLATELHRIQRSFERHLDDLQEGLLDVRMVPLGQVFDRLARVVRQIAREHEKDVRVALTGRETEVDKLIVEELADPLMHLIRNAIDHGIESAKARELAGKPREGTLALNAFQKGNHVLIEIEDDGKGMDPAQLLAAGIRKGLIEASRKDVSEKEILGLIFVPGFSTRDQVTSLSGRGVGLDVVKTNILRLGGVVDVHSEPGVGTKFTITLPITLAILNALVVGVRGRRYAIPIANVMEALLLDERGVRTIEGREILTLRGRTLPLCRLDVLFGLVGRTPLELPKAPGVRARTFSGGRSYVIVMELGARRLGVVVDDLFGQQDIVIKPLGKSLGTVRGFAGATDLGDQRVTLVVDAPSLLDEVLTDHPRAQVLS